MKLLLALLFIPLIALAAPEDRVCSDGNVIGPNQQPEWTTNTRFPTTRIYVFPPWQVELEQWWIGDVPREGKPQNRLQPEIQIALPWKYQFGYFQDIASLNGRLHNVGQQIEMRHGLSDWGVIPLNPTVYGAWKFNDKEPDFYTLKLLLGKDLAPCWHWGGNLSYGRMTGGARSITWGLSQGVSYSAVDGILGVGIEMVFDHESEGLLEGKPVWELLTGPSIQWRPTPRTHLDIVSLIGSTNDSPAAEFLVVFGFEFGGDFEGKKVINSNMMNSRLK